MEIASITVYHTGEYSAFGRRWLAGLAGLIRVYFIHVPLSTWGEKMCVNNIISDHFSGVLTERN